MYFLKSRFIETGSTGLLPVPVPVQVGPLTGSGSLINKLHVRQVSLIHVR
jgi:hypothetical protein